MRNLLVSGLSGLVAATMLLTGCGGQPQSSGSTKNAPGTPAKPKEITIVQGLFPETLDPHLTTVQATHNVSTQIYQPLLMLDYDTGTHTPILAKSWKQVDPTTWLFELREGVKFTNGEEFTAETVKFNIERIARPDLKSPVMGELKVVAGSEVVSKYVIKIKTKEPAPTLPLALNRFYVVPEKYAKEKGDAELAKNPVGTGPYKLKELQKDEKVVLVANPDYWGGKPSIDQVTFKGITEASTRVSALRAGEAQLVTNLNIADVTTIQKESQMEVLKVPSLRNMYVILDATKGGPVADKRVRLALNYAVDKKAITANILQGYGEELRGQWLTKAYFGFNADLKEYPYDPAKAKQLLQEAGYTPDQISFTFYAPTGRYSMDKEVAQAVAGQLTQLGIKVNLKTVEWGTFINDLLAKKMTPAIFIGMSTPPDAAYHLGLHTTGNVYSYYANPEFDSLLKDAAQSTDPAQRSALYKKATELMNGDPPGIALYQQVDIYGASKRLKGFRPRPDERIVLIGTDVD